MLVSENKRPEVRQLQKRAQLPKFFRVGAVAAFFLALVVLVVGFYLGRNRTEFKLKPDHARLSKDVVAEVDGYERTESDGDQKKFYIKADKATTFSDNHQELQNVLLRVFDDKGETYDQITSEKGLYIPAENKNFTAYFAGSVNIETRDALKVKTEQIVYTRENQTAEAQEKVEFERENVRGRADGALVKIGEKKLELLKNVEIDAAAAESGDDLSKSNIQSAKITADYASVDQNAEKIELADNVFISIIPDTRNSEMSQPSEIKADKATASFTQKEIRQIDLAGRVDVYQKPTAANTKWTRTKADRATAKIDKELKTVELFDNVAIETASNDTKPTKVDSGYAIYEKDIDRFQLKSGVHIVTVEDDRPTDIRAAEAVYEQTNGKIYLNGSAVIDNGRELLKGEQMTADLFPNKKIRWASARGGSYLRQTVPERTTEVSADQLQAAFDENQQLQTADAVTNSRAVLTPQQNADYTQVTLSAPKAVHLKFRGAGLLEQMNTDGRTTIQLNAPANRPDAANKKLTADAVRTFFNANGKDLTRAEAVGNAELYVEPLRTGPANYKTTVTAPRFDCEFFPTGNNAKTCVGQLKTKTVRVPTTADEKRGPQTLLADKLNAQFDQQTQDVKQFDALGNTKFTELDRTGIADQMNFTSEDQVVRLRGGEPTVWDARARARADEIDWDTKNEKSFLRGSVSTTYYSQKQTNGATPFGQTNKPVYVTAAGAEFNHRDETGLYTGNARAWQENNYVRADSLLLNQKTGQMTADGTVQSVLYDAKKKEKGRETTVPVYASSQKLFYNRDTRFLKYEENVDIRQGTDRITAGVANIYLTEKNEMSKTIAENNVVITQPNRRAVGDWVQYTADNEVAVLRGNPARVDDAENGTSQGAQMTVNMRDNRVVTESRTEQTNTGRIRSVYKVKKNE
ncbi:MAG: LPS export ABC transporter periplasmic protein LptC [Acidobacteria bacterium]|nr:LPS export ABC transporter periplasmic protein LptC [Acidobacteriota bacterium]